MDAETQGAILFVLILLFVTSAIAIHEFRNRPSKCGLEVGRGPNEYRLLHCIIKGIVCLVAAILMICVFQWLGIAILSLLGGKHLHGTD